MLDGLVAKFASLDGSTIVGIAALMSSAISFALGYHLNLRNSIASVRPVLVFEYSRESGWVLRNVGRGPALNVVIHHRPKGGEWFKPVRVPPIGAQESFVGSWLGHVNTLALGASYADVDGRMYSSVTASDLTTTYTRYVFPKWRNDQIGRHWAPPKFT